VQIDHYVRHAYTDARIHSTQCRSQNAHNVLVRMHSCMGSSCPDCTNPGCDAGGLYVHLDLKLVKLKRSLRSTTLQIYQEVCRVKYTGSHWRRLRWSAGSRRA
jgi:hypothetical protein